MKKFKTRREFFGSDLEVYEILKPLAMKVTSLPNRREAWGLSEYGRNTRKHVSFNRLECNSSNNTFLPMEIAFNGFFFATTTYTGVGVECKGTVTIDDHTTCHVTVRFRCRAGDEWEVFERVTFTKSSKTGRWLITRTGHRLHKGLVKSAVADADTDQFIRVVCS